MDGTTEVPDVRLTMVITLKSGVQIRTGVKSADIRRSASTGKLLEVGWILDGDPLGSSIGYVDRDEVAAIHYEREPRKEALERISVKAKTTG